MTALALNWPRLIVDVEVVEVVVTANRVKVMSCARLARAKVRGAVTLFVVVNAIHNDCIESPLTWTKRSHHDFWKLKTKPRFKSLGLLGEICAPLLVT